MQLENATKGLQKVKPGDLNWLQLTSADSTRGPFLEAPGNYRAR